MRSLFTPSSPSTIISQTTRRFRPRDPTWPSASSSWPCQLCQQRSRRTITSTGQSGQQTNSERETPHDRPFPAHPYRFETGFALYAKRTPRPFPPPFLSPPSGSFSDPLSTHHQSRDRRARINGDIILGRTNGDDAVFASDYLICANDGVGAWSARPRGHAGLWSRLILHFWATSLLDDATKQRPPEEPYTPDPVTYLQYAYDSTVMATAAPVDLHGTTTASGAQLHYRINESDPKPKPIVYATNLGDCQVMIIRPKEKKVIFKTTEQWHWFDCPLQLGTNSPDTPKENAVVDEIEAYEGDVVLAMTDGVIDNLWEHDIVENICHSIERWEKGEGGKAEGERTGGANGGMKFAAEELMTAAKNIALDPFAQSPYMEHAIEEGLASEGGKPDDISVVAALITGNEAWRAP